MKGQVPLMQKNSSQRKLYARTKSYDENYFMGKNYKIWKEKHEKGQPYDDVQQKTAAQDRLSEKLVIQ